MSHDSTFPDSAEAPDKRTDRALEALKIENEAGLGFRRRERAAMGNPYADPERYQVDREPTPGELWAGLLAGLGVALAVGALFYKPILFGVLAVVFTTIGSLGDGQAAKVARWGFVLSLACIFLGMVMAIFVTNTALW